MLFHALSLFLLIFLNACSLSVEATTIPSSSPTTVPSVKEKIQRVIAFTEGITAITEVFNSPEPVGRNLTKLLEGSRKCGLVLHAGLSFDGIKETPEVKNLRNKSFILSRLIDKQNENISNAHIEATLFYNIYEIHIAITFPLRSLMNEFKIVLNTYSPENIQSLKYICGWIDPLEMLGTLKLVLNQLKSKVINADYSDQMYENLHIIYQLAPKQTLGMLPLCHIYNHGPPDVVDQNFFSDTAIETIRVIRKKFTDLNNLRKQNYWKNETMTILIKRSVTNGYMVPFPSNRIIGKSIYENVMERYISFGYNYHVIVSNAAQRGHNDTLIQCSTECHYLYNFLGKDVYVMRTKKSQKGQNYSSCKYLDGFENGVNGDYTCYQRYNFHEKSSSLEPLAKDIAGNCTGVAFSLVRSQLNYFTIDGSNECKWVNDTCIHEYQGFTSKCKDGVHIVFANYPK